MGAVPSEVHEDLDKAAADDKAAKEALLQETTEFLEPIEGSEELVNTRAEWLAKYEPKAVRAAMKILEKQQ